MAGSLDTAGPHPDYAAELEVATRGLLSVNVAVLESMEKRIGLAPLRALQALQRLGPSLVTELGTELDMVPSSTSRLCDRLDEAGLITRRVAPHNRRATLLELTEAGRSILDELVTHRAEVLGRVAANVSEQDRRALLRGATAFTVAYYEHGHDAAPSDADSPDP